MAFGTVMSVVHSLLAALQSSQLKEICSILGYKYKLDHLCDTVIAVQVVLLDAGAKQELPHEAQLWIEELKDVVYDADDLVDEFVTLVEQKHLIEGGKVSEEVHLFFSRFNLFGVAYDMSQRVNKIREKLDTIASYENHYGFTLDLPIRKRREETPSYNGADSIIGREDDVSKIVDMLFGPDVHDGIYVLSIVGIGGLGKTALANLVYNHERVTSGFQLRLWTCISDQDQQQFDVMKIVSKIVRSCIEQEHNDSTDHQTQEQLMEQVARRKFLLVLDDVGIENHDQWLKLLNFLMSGRRGRWIIVTTRSRETSKVVGNGIYELQALSGEKSWCLFERMAFEQAAPADDLVKIGEKIVEGCAGVPLAIRVVGSNLYGQAKSKWLSFQEIGSADIRDCNNNIMPLLKLSYSQLNTSLKICFTYCALFPKDFEVEKEMLINLWIAQGYVIPFNRSQSIEDAGEEYFSILLRRGFFQDVKVDKYGDIISCKIHALMHDVAQEFAGREICVANSVTCHTDRRVRHLSIIRSKYTGNSFSNTRVRTFLQVGRRMEWINYPKTN